MEIKDLSLEQAFVRLEDTISRLESEDITLEESFAEYKAGMELLKHCNDSIDKVEKQVMMLSAEGGLEPYQGKEG